MNIVLVTNALYPEGDAESIRIHVFAKLFQAMGHEVFVISNGKTGQFKERIQDGVPYSSLKTDSTNLIGRYLGFKMFSHNMIRLLEQHAAVRPFDAILAADLKNDALDRLKQYCKTNRIPLIFDAVEWYSPEQFEEGEQAKGFREKDYQNRIQLDPSVNVVAVSRYLSDYFAEKGCHTLRIPILYEREVSVREVQSVDKIQIGYAGSKGRAKDYLEYLFHTLGQENSAFLEQFQFHIVGWTESDLMDFSEEERLRIGSCCRFYGRLPHDKTLEVLLSTDFVFFLRDSKLRFTKAGFPSKSVEALSNGLILITNLSSDLELYLNDKENSILVDNLSVEAVKKALTAVAALSQEDIKIMKQKASASAKQYFYYKNYLPDMEEYLNNLI